MNHIIALTTLSLITLSCKSQQKSYSLTVPEFEKAVLGNNVQVLDVRTATEYNSGHLKKSLHADWYNQKQFKERVNALDKTKPVYVYCITGVRSEAAVKWMKENGLAHAYDLKGGLTAWKKAGKPVDNTVSIRQITTGEYNAQISSTETVLVDFGAEWCPPCKKMEPIIARLKNESAGKYKIINIDAGAQTSLLNEMNVESLPVFIVYKNGKEIWRKQGIASFEELKTQLQTKVNN